jgi:hypothetical protein
MRIVIAYPIPPLNIENNVLADCKGDRGSRKMVFSKRWEMF